MTQKEIERQTPKAVQMKERQIELREREKLSYVSYILYIL